VSSKLYDIHSVAKRIEAGEKLFLAGHEEALKQLPQGFWMAGTIPYFMAEAGGEMSKERVYVTALDPIFEEVTLVEYDADSLSNVYKEIPDNGVGMIVIPAMSQTHLSFALNAPKYEGFASKPLVGWISGVHLDELGVVTPKVFNGRTGRSIEDGALVMCGKLPASKVADVNILNIFKQGDGDRIEFKADGFSATEAIVNGETVDFARYIEEKKLDTRLPLVADYSGAMVNTSFQSVGEGKVDFYAPVFAGLTYKHAAPVEDYVGEFTRQLEGFDGGTILFSCNCILNYLYSELEGKQTGGITGPITFGEIAFQLLNQTLAYISIYDV
jgi:hypothetical protein